MISDPEFASDTAAPTYTAPPDPLRVQAIAECVVVERAFLATLIEAPERTADVIAWGASLVWFTEPICAVIWDGIEKLHARGIPPDFALVVATIDDFGAASDESRQLAQVVKLGETARNPAYLKHFAKTLRRFAAERATKDIAEGIVRERAAPETPEDYAQMVTHGASALLDVAGSVLAETERDPRAAIAQAAEEALDAADAKPGVYTGISNLDRFMRGMRAGEMIVVGARPGVGKSSFAVTVCTNLLHRDPEAVIFFASVEMPSREILKRFVSILSGVSVEAIENRTASPEEVNSWRDAAAFLERAEPVVANRGMTSAAQILAGAQSLKVRRQRLDLVIVDHLHRMIAKGDNRTAQLTAISGAVAMIAPELEVPVLALAQLNRGVETREDKTLTLADLRDSGSIEQDADMVIFLHRPGASGSTNVDATKTTAIIAKNRRGQTGSASLRFIPHLTRFVAEEPADNVERFTI